MIIFIGQQTIVNLMKHGLITGDHLNREEVKLRQVSISSSPLYLCISAFKPVLFAP